MQELIERWQAGDNDAFDELFHQYKRLVFKNALLISGNVGDAEDILQEVFLKLWTAKHTFSPGKGNFINWLYKITVNQSISKCRKKKISSLSLDQIDSGGGIIDNREMIEPNLDRKWEYEALTKLVSQMDDKHRLVLILKYFDDLPNKAIAEILDIPIGTVKSRLHNALASLRKKWDGMEEK